MTKSLFSKMIFQKRWWILWWFIAATATALSTTVFFPAFKGSNISKVFNSLPASVQHIAGTGSSFNSISGYVSNEVFGFRAPLIIIILSIIVFNNLTVGEERRGILEAQISLPFTRSKILFSKLFAGISVIVLASAGLFVGVVLGLSLIHYHYPLINIFQLTLSAAVLGIMFGLVVFTLNAMLGIRSIVLGLSCAYAFLAYLLTTLVTNVHGLSVVEKGSLFHYYSTTGNFSYRNLLVMLYIAIIFIFISFLFFRKRDIET